MIQQQEFGKPNQSQQETTGVFNQTSKMFEFKTPDQLVLIQLVPQTKKVKKSKISSSKTLFRLFAPGVESDVQMVWLKTCKLRTPNNVHKELKIKHLSHKTFRHLSKTQMREKYSSLNIAIPKSVAKKKLQKKKKSHRQKKKKKIQEPSQFINNAFAEQNKSKARQSAFSIKRPKCFDSKHRLNHLLLQQNKLVPKTKKKFIISKIRSSENVVSALSHQVLSQASKWSDSKPDAMEGYNVHKELKIKHLSHKTFHHLSQTKALKNPLPETLWENGISFFFFPKKRQQKKKKKQIRYNNKNLRNQIRINKQHQAFSIKRPKCFDSKRPIIPSLQLVPKTKSTNSKISSSKTRCWIRRPKWSDSKPDAQRAANNVHKELKIKHLSFHNQSNRVLLCILSTTYNCFNFQNS